MPTAPASTQVFDAANRLTRPVDRAGAGVEGPTAESFAYDGLSRLTQVQSGSHVTSRTYDSLSRRLSEATNGRTVGYQHDDAGNADAADLPLGPEIVTQSFDALEPPAGGRASAARRQVSYGFRGADLVATKSLGNGLAGATTYDPVREGRRVDARRRGASKPFYRAALLEPAQPQDGDPARRSERPGLRRRLRRRPAPDRHPARSLAPFAQPALQRRWPRRKLGPCRSPASCRVGRLHLRRGGESPRAADRSASRCRDADPSSPSDGSGRNRPALVRRPARSPGTPTAISSARAPDHFAWDYRNRLTRVTRDGAGEIARYEYDAFNRLTKRGRRKRQRRAGCGTAGSSSSATQNGVLAMPPDLRRGPRRGRPRGDATTTATAPSRRCRCRSTTRSATRWRSPE